MVFFYSYFFSLNIIGFMIGILFFFKNNVIKAGICLPREIMQCTVIKTIESCMNVQNPWNNTYFKPLYNYISTGYKVGQNFTLTRYLEQAGQGVDKFVYSGSHLNPALKYKQQHLIIKYWRDKRTYTLIENNIKIVKPLLIKELHEHAQWAIATHEVFRKGADNYIWTQPIIASCPSQTIELSDLVFIEPKLVTFAPPTKCPKRFKQSWKTFNDKIWESFGFHGFDEQCFDGQYFGREIGTFILMTDTELYGEEIDNLFAAQFDDNCEL
jgi:hypothetical protein